MAPLMLANYTAFDFYATGQQPPSNPAAVGQSRS